MPRRRIKQGGEAGALGGSGLAEWYMERLEKTTHMTWSKNVMEVWI